MPNDTNPEPGTDTPADFLRARGAHPIYGGGFVFGFTPRGYCIHSDAVDPATAEPGEVLYLKSDALADFVALVDYASEQMLPAVLLDTLKSGACPVDFFLNGEDDPLYSTFGPSPMVGMVVAVPGHIADLRVDEVRVSYEPNGARRVSAFCS